MTLPSVRVAIFSEPFWPTIGGVQLTTRLLARGLVELGHAVEIVTGDQLANGAELSEGYHVHRQRTLSKCCQVFRRSNLVVCKGGVSKTAGVAAFLMAKPLLIWHEMAGPHWGWKDSFPSRLLKRAIVRYAVAHVAVSRTCLESLKLPASARAKYLYNPVDPELESLATDLHHEPKNTDLLFVGRMIASKGVFVLAEALRILDAAGKRLVASFVGGGPELDAVRAAVSSLRNVTCRFAGELRGAALAHAYATARIAVVPSLTPEGMSLVTAEALAFGLPLIASDLPVLQEVAGKAALFYARESSRALANAIAQVLDDNALSGQLAVMALQRFDTFRHSKWCEQVNTLLQELFQAPLRTRIC